MTSSVCPYSPQSNSRIETQLRHCHYRPTHLEATHTQCTEAIQRNPRRTNRTSVIWTQYADDCCILLSNNIRIQNRNRIETLVDSRKFIPYSLFIRKFIEKLFQ